jgi:hypothetical protein
LHASSTELRSGMSGSTRRPNEVSACRRDGNWALGKVWNRDSVATRSLPVRGAAGAYNVVAPQSQAVLFSSAKLKRVAACSLPRAWRQCTRM